MVSRSCRRFRARFIPGLPGPKALHLRRCRACAEYARALEHTALAARRAPLPEELCRRLMAIPTSAGAGGKALEHLPVPQLELPAPLAARLRALPARAAAPPAPQRLPVFLRSPRYVVAASYLLTVLTVALFGNPARLGGRAAALDEGLPAVLARMGSGLSAAARGLDARLDELTGAAGPASNDRDRGPAGSAGERNR